MKEFGKIIIDPYKNKMLEKEILKIIKESYLIFQQLQRFINITIRKHIFEHEYHHLCNVLLYYFYLNESSRLNTPIKEIYINSVKVI